MRAGTLVYIFGRLFVDGRLVVVGHILFVLLALEFVTDESVESPDFFW